MSLPAARRVVVETACLAGVAAAAGWLLVPSNPLLTGVALHPFVLVAVLVAGRYGSAAGLAASALLLALYELGGFAAAAGGRLPSVFELPHSLTASALVVAPLVVGAFVDSYRASVARLEAAGEEGARLAQAQRARLDELDAANRELRARVLGESDTLQSLYDMAQKLSALEPKDLYPAVLELLARHYEAERASFYVADGGGLRLVAQRGWESVPREAVWLPDPAGLLGRALREGRLLSLKDRADGDGGGDDKVIAVPLRDPEDGRVVAVIAVEKIPFKRLGPQTLRALRLVADWTARSIANAQLFLSAGTASGERHRLIADLLRGLGSRTVPVRVIQQLAALGRDILPELTRLLSHVNAHHHQRDNLLSLLEMLQERGISPEGAEFSAAAREAFRSWMRLQRYRVAAARLPEGASALFLSYLDERQAQVKRQADRILVLYLAARQMRDSAKTDEAIADREDPILAELADTLSSISSGEQGKIEHLASERFGLAAASAPMLAMEIAVDPDHWLRASAMHMFGLSGDRVFAAAALRCVRDPNPVVRESALAAFVRLGGVDGEPIESILEDRLKLEPDPGPRAIAQQALNELRLDRSAPAE